MVCSKYSIKVRVGQSILLSFHTCSPSWNFLEPGSSRQPQHAVGHTVCALGRAGVPTATPPSPWKGGKLILHPAGSKAELLLFHIHQHPELFTASKGAALQTLPSSSLLPLCITAPWCSASGGVQACLSLSFCSSACGNCSLIRIFLTKRLEI